MNRSLNKEQNEAVEYLKGPLLILAGAGSGKTSVVTHRIANLISKGVPASKILGLTFTNKAANEMKERVQRLTQQNVLICTFHSLGARLLRESIHHLGYIRDFVIYDEDDADKLLKTCVGLSAAAEFKPDLKAIRTLISRTKNSMVPPEQVLGGEQIPFFPAIYALYEAKLKEYNAVDYDDLLVLPVKLFKQFPEILQHYQERWQFVHIDEYQDTNGVQYALVQLLVNAHKNLCVVGDPDQSIYSWRGANIQNILNFERDYPGSKVITLEQNYRSRSNILNASNAVIAYNDRRFEKKLWSARGPGEKIKLYRADTERTEAIFVADKIVSHHREDSIPLNDMVVFYRTNAQSRALEDHLMHRRIPYVIVGGISFYQRREIKDILAWLRMVTSGKDFIAFDRTINLPKRGFGDTTIDKIRLGSEQEGISIFEYCEKVVSGNALKSPLKISARQKEGLQDYVRIVHALKTSAQTSPLSQLVKDAIELTGYRKHLEEDKETESDRTENLSELLSKAMEWEMSVQEPSLEAFLEELSLKSSLDDADVQERITLMTIHNGKGLEFTVTFLVGMEEGLFPHINSKDSAEGMEEERRLCYVGMTRAKEYLYLTHATTRAIWGTMRTQALSRFVKEVPSEYIERLNGRITPFAGEGAYSKPTQRFSASSTARPTVEEEAPGIGNGDLVFHQEFGIGRVQNTYQGSLGLTYTILFSKDNCEKNIVARYAQLSRI